MAIVDDVRRAGQTRRGPVWPGTAAAFAWIPEQFVPQHLPLPMAGEGRY